MQLNLFSPAPVSCCYKLVLPFLSSNIGFRSGAVINGDLFGWALTALSGPVYS